MDTPYSLIRLDQTYSTQEIARAGFSGSPVLVIADRQTAGRGRGGSEWLTAPMGLAASLAFRHRGHPLPTIPLTAGVAAIRVVSGMVERESAVGRRESAVGRRESAVGSRASAVGSHPPEGSAWGVPGGHPPAKFGDGHPPAGSSWGAPGGHPPAESSWGVPGGHPPAKLKWPNDVMVGDRKVGGILSEAVGEVVVVGLGLNLWWPDPPAGMAALFPDRPRSATTQEMGELWAGELLGLLSSDDWPLGEYREMCGTVGETITWEPGGSGMAKGVADDGGLIVESGGESLVLRSGAVRHVRVGG